MFKNNSLVMLLLVLATTMSNLSSESFINDIYNFLPKSTQEDIAKGAGTVVSHFFNYLTNNFDKWANKYKLSHVLNNQRILLGQYRILSDNLKIMISGQSNNLSIIVQRLNDNDEWEPIVKKNGLENLTFLRIKIRNYDSLIVIGTQDYSLQGPSIKVSILYIFPNK